MAIMLFMLVSQNTFAQHAPCSHNHAQEEYYKANPAEKIKADQIEKIFLKEALKNKAKKGTNTANKTWTESATDKKVLPVVFHIIYGCEEGPENLSKERIDEAMLQLNEDFNGVSADNGDPVYPNKVGNMNIDFVLAEKDPLGNPTSGVTRTRSDLTYMGVGYGPELRELVQWPRENYLNVYVANKALPADNSGVAIYPKDAHNNPINDGVAMAHWAVAPVLPNRLDYKTILSHEVGHWLGLRHIWGDSNYPELGGNCDLDDFKFIELDETLTQAQKDAMLALYNDTENTTGNSTIGSTDSCPVGSNTCTSSGLDMIDNFMDYTGCAITFTDGQVAYMQDVLQSPIAERDNLIKPATTALTTYINNTGRAVFQEESITELSSNTGQVNDTIDIKVLDFAYFSPNSGTLTENNGFTVNWNGLTGLSAKIKINGNYDAQFIITGTTNQHHQDVDITVTIDQNRFVGVYNLAERTKVIKVDFIEEAGIVYNNQLGNPAVGPDDQLYVTARPNPGSFIEIVHGDTGFGLVTSENLEICILNGALRTFTNTTTYIPTNSNSFASYTNLNNLLNIDFNTLPSGEFYLGYRFGCSSFKYGWLRVEKSTSPCSQIIIKDMAYNALPNNIIQVGNVGSGMLVFEDNVMRESTTTANSFSTATLKLKGALGTQKFANPLPANAFTIEEIDPAYPSIPAGFDISDLTITRNNDTQVTVSLTTTQPEQKDITFKLVPTTTAFNTNYLPKIDEDNFIKIDFIRPFDLAYFPQGQYLSYALGSFMEVTGYINGQQSNIGFVGATNSFLVYNPITFNPFTVEVACKSANSQEIRLFTEGESTANVAFEPLGLGGFEADGATPAPNERLLMLNDMTSFPQDDAYILLKYKISCDYSITAWMRINTTEAPNLEVMDQVISMTPNTIVEIGDVPPCFTSVENPTEFLFIDNMTMANINNPSTVEADAVSDFTNLTINLTPNAATPVSFTQGNPVNYTPATSPHWYAFIDLNNNGSFSPDEKVLDYEGTDLVSGYASGTNSQTAPYLYVPSAPLSTPLKMRVILSFHPVSSNLICGSFQYGEVEDYTVIIGSAPQPCNAPPAAQFTQTPYENKLRLKATNFVGQNHQFRYRTYGTGAWDSLAITTNLYSWTPNTLEACTLYQYQLRVQCADGTWSGWRNRNAWTRAPRVQNAQLSTPDLWCTGAHLYFHNLNGNKKLVRYREVGGTWSGWTALDTDEYYVTYTNLTSGTNYQYDIRVKCGTTGAWSLWKVVNFTTASCKSKDSEPLILATPETVVNVYPNPVQDFVNIEMIGENALNNVAIYDIQGRLVKDFTSQIQDVVGSMQIDISEFAKGIYILKVNDTNIERIVKM